jgi:hypothetical protein
MKLSQYIYVQLCCLLLFCVASKLTIISVAASGSPKSNQRTTLESSPVPQKAAIVVPAPLTVGIDDLGWKQGWSTDVAEDRNKPSHIDCPEGRWMGMADYEAIVGIAKSVKSRLLCLFIMSEFDRSNICAEYPTTTEQGENWDNSALVSDNDYTIMNYVKRNAAHMEFGLHGVRHEHWDDGNITFAEFAGGNYNRRPYPVETVTKHLECYKRLIDQYDISFPKSFVPPKHCYYYDPNNPMDTGGLVASWGIKYVSWGHKYWQGYDRIVSNPLSYCQFDHGVLVLERDQAVPWRGSLGVAPEAISMDFYYECTHWHNYIAARPQDNPTVGKKWIKWFNLIKDSPGRYLPKNTAQLYAQALYLEYAKFYIEGDKVSIDNTNMPDWAYEKEFIGNLVIKVPLIKGQHISSVSFDQNEQIACCYEDRGFGYVVLPALKQKRYEVQINAGPQLLSNCVVNNGTYNVKRLEIKPETVLLKLEMYGTQEVHVKLAELKPRDVKSLSKDLTINSWKWDEQEKFCVINVTAQDIQGAQGEIVLHSQVESFEKPFSMVQLDVCL